MEVEKGCNMSQIGGDGWARFVARMRLTGGELISFSFKAERLKLAVIYVNEAEDDEDDDYGYNKTIRKTTTTTTYQAPTKRTEVVESYDDYEDEYESGDEDLSEVLKDITNRYNKLDFTNDDNMGEKLRLIRDIENLIDRENGKGEGIYSSNEDIRQIFTDLQDVVDDMKNAL